MKFIVVLLLFSLSWPRLSAQTTSDEESWLRYCIGVKGRFYSESECNTGRRPKFEALGLALKQNSVAIEEKDITAESQLRSGVYFDYDLKGTGDFKSDLFNDLVTGASDFKLYYDLRVSEIKNDTHIDGEFFKSEGRTVGRVTGLNPTEDFGASDPCSNSFNWSSNRESYELLLDVIVDDPVPLANETDEEGLSDTRLNPDEDHLALKVGDFYENSKGTPRLQVAVGNDPKTAQWKTIPYVTVVPNSTIELFYPQIAGGKNTDRYWDLLGENLMFMVSKTLMNGKESYGSVVMDVRFDPPGPQFYIREVTRSACESSLVNVFVCLSDARDQRYMEEGNSKFKWKYTANRADVRINSGTCTMEFDRVLESGEAQYKLIPHPDGGGLSPFTIEEELVYSLQLQDADNESTNYCTREFTVPGKPESVKVSQQAAAFSLNGSSYHLLSLDKPYAILDIKDPWELAHLRQPYKIYKGTQIDGEPLHLVSGESSTYEDLSDAEKREVQAEYKVDSVKQLTYNSEYLHRLSPFGRYFESRFAIWRAQNSGPVLHLDNYVEPSRSFVPGIDLNQRVSSNSYRFYINPDENEYKQYYFIFENELSSFYWGSSCVILNDIDHCVMEDGRLIKGWLGGSEYATISKTISLSIFDYNSKVMITRLPGQTASTDPFYWTTIGSDGTITKTKISDAGKNIKLASDGKHCFFTSMDGLVLYVFDGTNNTMLNSDLQITEIVGVDVENKLCLFKSAGKTYSQIYDMDHYYEDLYTLKYFGEWKEQFFDDYWQRWVQNRYGYRLTGVTPNVEEVYTLVDQDGCDVSIKVEVRIPELPIIETLNIETPENRCATNGKADLKYFGGGNPPYSYGLQQFRNPEDVITIDDLGYGDNWVDLLNDLGEIAVRKNINIALTDAVSVYKKDATCYDGADYNGRIELVLTSEFANTDNKEFILTNLATREVKTLAVGSTSLSEAFDNLAPAEYEIKVKVGGCTVHKETIVIENRLFSVICIPDDAATFGGTGALEFNFTHQSGNVSWAGVYPAQLQVVSQPNATFNGISPYVYDGIIVVHTDEYGRTCNFELPAVTIYSPKVSAEVGLVVVINGEETSVRLSSDITQMNTLASVQAEVLLYKDLVLLEQESVVFEDEVYGLNDLTLTEDGDYKLMFSCENGSIELAAFTLPIPLISYNMQLEPARCPNDDNQMTFSALSGGLGAGSYLLGIDGSSFSEQNTWYFSGPKSKVYLQNKAFEKYLVSGSEVEFSGTLTHIVEEDLVYPERVHSDISRVNVTCHGKNNGRISVSNAQKGGGSYAWRLGNNDTWMDTVQIADNLPPGSYAVYLKDSGNNCAEVNIGSVSLEEPEDLMVVDSDSIAPVCSDGRGWISMTLEGGNGWYSYVLEKNDVVSGTYPLEDFTDELSVTFENLGSGAYILTATDPLGCEVEKDFVLAQYDDPEVDRINVEPVVCHDQSNGTIEIIETSGTGQLEFMYLLDEDKVELAKLELPNQKFEGLSAGHYRLLLQDINGCLSDTVHRIVEQPLPLELTVESVQPVVAKGGDNGRIRARAVGGNNTELMVATVSRLGLEGKEEVQVNSIVEGRLETFDKLNAGAYEIEVADHKNCRVVSDVIELLEPEEALTIETVEIKDALCKARVGSFSIRGAGGWGAYSYKMATAGGYTSISTFEELYAGSYEVIVEDSLGAKVSTVITINEPDFLMTKVVDQMLPTCGSNGAMEVEVSGGNGPYKLVLDSATDSLDIASPQIVSLGNLPAGAYTLTTIDLNGCRAQAHQFLSGEDLLTIVGFEPDYPSAPGSADGQVTAIVQGGQSPLDFVWKDLFAQGLVIPSEGAQMANVGSGYYEVTVSDAGACTQSDRFYLPSVNDGFLEIRNLGHETSLDARDGFALLLSGQPSLNSVEVYYPGNLIENLTGDDPSLVGGAISLSDLPGGKYLVRAVGPGQVEIAEFEIKTYEAFTFGKITVNDVNARGLSDGSISLVVDGGVPDFVFEWEAVDGSLASSAFRSHGNTGMAEGLVAGTYHVRVSDHYGNVIERSIEVREPADELTVELAEVVNQSCKNYEDAWVRVSASGGWGDYQYRHAGSEVFENHRRWNNLPVGSHKFFIIDKKGIVDSVSITITEPDLLRANVALIDSVNCFGDANGKVYFELTGGTAPYRFAEVGPDPFWSSNTGVLNAEEGERSYYLDDDLTEGQRVYRFTDANNCLATDTLTVYVPQPDELLFSYTNVVHTTCNTDNGRVEVGMQGGTLPYRYRWSNSEGEIVSTAATAADLKQQGFYELNVWDKNDCHRHFEQSIKASTLPAITEVNTEPVLCYGDSNGTAVVTEAIAAEPFAPYTFIWSNNSVGEATDGLPAGRHYVTVRDTNQCETVRYFDVATPDTLGLSVVSLKHAHCYGYNDGHIEIMAFGGVGNYSYLWSNGEVTNKAVDLSKGDYSLAFTDANNCLFGQSFIIDEPAMETVDAGEDFMMCPGNSIVVDGRDFKAHEWRLGDKVLSAERYFTVRDEGEYYLKVTNNIGCFAYDTLAVAIGNNALQADFLMSSEAFPGDTLLLYELSNLPLDSLSWEYPLGAFIDETPEGADDYILHLKTLKDGMFNVALYAYSGGCFSKKVKQIEIKEGENEGGNDDFLGYRDPLIQSFIVSPNPNNGHFNVNVGLREVNDIHLALFSISQGHKLEERNSNGLKEYSEPFVLTNVNTGVYVVILTAGSERRQVKIVIE